MCSDPIKLDLTVVAWMRLHIVLLYYVLEKTDEEIYRIMHMKSRSLVQYHRTAAIRQLRQWIGEMEDEYDLL